MKVLVADRFEASGLAGLKAAGCDVAHEPDVTGDALLNGLKGHRAVGGMRASI